LILREKNVRGSTKKNYEFSKNIEKTQYRRVAQKKVKFCTRRSKSHFFLTHPVEKKRLKNFVVKCVLLYLRHFFVDFEKSKKF